MKRLLLAFALIALTSASCYKDDGGSTTSSGTDRYCGKDSAGRTLYKGPSGGCYYINSSGNKTYVDRSLCNC